MTCHYLGSASDKNFLSTNQKHYQVLGSDASSVWNFCARCSDVVLRGLKWRPQETSAVFSGTRTQNDFLKGRINHSQLLAIFHETKEKLENMSPMLSSCNHFNPSDPQPNTLNYGLGKLVE